ncbi:hypothetical protein B1L02_18250 [Pseudoalteromonas piscicida]|uniref:Uncharacterized protein n=1 Tax=Pseudoalteromonas piscicida TaxID=43662 RepID=A0AAD0W5Q7_PSEO7|nr:hypothetical protein B1L02_18250 [Pseudoalteromonas piscicida]AXQ99516.1 hypothetical protein D0N37_18540 [Pseudoalteromonas piscicida]AXR03831.1 hypothetical protein D0511_18330 [Pseudoalteromonas piscicida]
MTRKIHGPITRLLEVNLTPLALQLDTKEAIVSKSAGIKRNQKEKLCFMCTDEETLVVSVLLTKFHCLRIDHLVK